MLFHTVQRLLEEGTPARRLVYLSIETPIYTGIALESLLRIAWEASGEQVEKASEWAVFFDEIQYLKDWEIHLKSLADSFRNVKFVVSGSAAAALKLKSRESGAGRFTDFMLPPLTFNEFIELKGNNHLIKQVFLQIGGKNVPYFGATFEKELNEQFIEYINYGGYPEVIFSEITSSKFT